MKRFNPYLIVLILVSGCFGSKETADIQELPELTCNTAQMPSPQQVDDTFLLCVDTYARKYCKTGDMGCTEYVGANCRQAIMKATIEIRNKMIDCGFMEGDKDA